jgi:hypothetical protein
MIDKIRDYLVDLLAIGIIVVLFAIFLPAWLIDCWEHKI